MNEDKGGPRPRLTTLRAAAIAGILFAILMTASLVLVRISVPANPADAGVWLASSAASVALGLNLLPFAGIAFLWFVGVLRERLGSNEDRLFATVFLGSGLLFLATLFASAAVAGGILAVYSVAPERLVESGTYGFGRAVTYVVMNVYAMKMAGVFMMSTSTLSLRTGITPRWMALLGVLLALLLILSVSFFYWAPLIFPLWALLISIYILIDN